MKPSGFYDLTISAGASAILQVTGDYFKVMSVTSAINITSDFGSLKGLTAGQGLENTQFTCLTIQNPSGASNTIRIFIGDENFIDGMTGSIAVSSTTTSRDTYTHTPATVTTTAANAVAAASRDYIAVQNKSATGTIYVHFNGAATVANGLRLRPGDFWESGASCPQGAVSCIGDIASNPDVLIITGV